MRKVFPTKGSGTTGHIALSGGRADSSHATLTKPLQGWVKDRALTVPDGHTYGKESS